MELGIQPETTDFTVL